MGRSLLLFMAIVARCSPFQLVPLNTEGDKASVILCLRTFAGDIVKGGTLKIRSLDGSGVKMTKQVSDNEVLSIPFGIYSVDFDSTMNRHVHQEYRVSSSQSLLLISTSFDSYDIPDMPASVLVNVTGKLTCGSGSAWVKMIGVFSPYIAEQGLSPLSSVQFDSLKHGIYMILYIDGKNVRLTKQLKTFGPLTRVALELPPC